MPNGSFWTGQRAGFERTPRFEPEVQNMMSQLLQSVGPQLTGQQGGFDPIRQRAVSQYKQEILPAAAERYAGRKDSSAYQTALSGEATGLAERLAAMESQYNLQRQGQLSNLLGMAMTPQQEIAYRPETSGFLGQAGGGLAQGLGMGIPMALGSLLGGAAGSFGGPVGTAAGGAAGAAGAAALTKLILSLFGKSRGVSV